MEGIYCYTDLKDNKVVYVGKDSNIHKNKRHQDHFQPNQYNKQPINRILQNNPNRYSYKILKQGKENTIYKVSTVEAVIKLLNETKKPVFEELMDKHMEMIANIIKRIPIYELTCNISKEAVDLVKETLFTEDVNE